MTAETARDMIIPWAEVQAGDLALDDASLILVDEITVHPQSDEHPDFMVACVSGYVLDDGPAARVHLDPAAAWLTAVRRPLTESQRFQVEEARDCLGTWDLARGGNPGIDRETVLADQVRALLGVLDDIAPRKEG